MSELQFYLKNEFGHHEYVVDPVEDLIETDSHWILDNGFGAYEVSKSEYENCKPYIRLAPPDDNPLYRMAKHLEDIGSSVTIDWT